MNALALLLFALVLLDSSGSSGPSRPVAAGDRESLVAPALTASDWADSARREIDRASPRGDVARLVVARSMLERALAVTPDDPILLHYRGFALFREAILRRERDQKDVGDLMDEAERDLERSSQTLKWPETLALLSSIAGQKIGNSPVRGMTLGPKSGRLMSEALRRGEANPRVWLLRGQGAIFTPKMFGGGLDKAEQYLRRALELFGRDAPRPPAPAWGGEEAWVWLGQVLQRQGRIGEAREAYARALELEPEDQWVKFVLLPALDRGRDSTKME